MDKVIFENEQLTVFQSGLYQTNSAVVKLAEMVLVSDPNWLPEEVAAIQRYAAHQAKVKELFLFLTHSDYDHIIGVGAFPGAKTIASRRFAQRKDKATELEQIIDFDDKHYILRTYPIFYPGIDLVIEGNDVEVPLPGGNWRGWMGPGHHPDGMILLEEESGILLVGDYLSDVEFPFVYDSFEAYHQTLDYFEAIITANRVRTLVPGHGSVTQDIKEMLVRLADSRAYLSDLETACRGDQDFPLERWLQRYDFPRGLRKAHEKNVERWHELHGGEQEKNS